MLAMSPNVAIICFKDTKGSLIFKDLNIRKRNQSLLIKIFSYLRSAFRNKSLANGGNPGKMFEIKPR